VRLAGVVGFLNYGRRHDKDLNSGSFDLDLITLSAEITRHSLSVGLLLFHTEGEILLPGDSLNTTYLIGTVADSLFHGLTALSCSTCVVKSIVKLSLIFVNCPPVFYNKHNCSVN